jgi:hypothetical protein
MGGDAGARKWSIALALAHLLTARLEGHRVRASQDFGIETTVS